MGRTGRREERKEGGDRGRPTAGLAERRCVVRVQGLPLASPHAKTHPVGPCRNCSGGVRSGEAGPVSIRTVQQLPYSPPGLLHTPFLTGKSHICCIQQCGSCERMCAGRCDLLGTDSQHAEDSMCACSQRLLLEVGWGGNGVQVEVEYSFQYLRHL